MGSQVRVRFAPSPTGYLHIGGARTALYNWLYARKTGGVFILRIEDTDVTRSTKESYEAILDALNWLGLDWDEGPEKGGQYGPYLQSARQVLYHTEAQKLLESGDAYRCFCTQKELEEMREEAAEKGEPTRYDGRCRNLPTDEAQRRLAMNVPHVVRIRIPEGETHFRDIIRGQVRFQNTELDDFVLIKSDGRPTYNFAVVVDDARMAITHVIRGDDHLSNMPKQVILYKALGYSLPKFAHLPMILGSDRSRLSKRHGASSVQEFRRMGYMSDSLVNYLALLGWSLDGVTEFFTRKSLIEKFSLKRVSKNPAAFDIGKLDFINGEHFKRLDSMEKVSIVFEKLEEEKLIPPDFRVKEWGSADAARSPDAKKENREAYFKEERPRLAFILKVMGHRLKNLKDVRSKLCYFYKDDYRKVEEAYKEHLANPEIGPHLLQMADMIEHLEPFERSKIEGAVRNLADDLEVSAGTLIHASRVALTGDSVSPDIFSVMHLLGRAKCIERLRQAASHVISKKS
ncbi:MAG: glutamate--tRNA ligase [Candidatus Latescibacteria bacterium]|nr:glutamate--tRNA ligase [Candidatus Latescibacterota bacterium]NIM66416.1 glutamate--tRNA ligase [Candidatus Latescibacterota bacterium]NIO02895.1 glutamate--tRNA ligase [Candidatus Latescibacterota bacterium]NIO30030.1 glutamate--tRNA ligase [Candidatus Latescibacterota bacterium]NIO57645.1 glutamate--tRNA ligase [Candidatus Latescibacterota bacterium]